MSISVGTINWTIGATTCTISDYTAQSTTLTAGMAEAMMVTSGVWTGCAVWVDMNNNHVFEDSENLYYNYVGGDPSYTYNFTITIPAGTPTGAYRMRVIAPWGSDGFLNTNINGYGPCGAYQYGNFDDFTVNVLGSTSINEPGASGSFGFVEPNPTTGLVSLTNDAQDPIEHITIVTPEGRVVREVVTGPAFAKVEIDLGDLLPGPYFLSCRSASNVRSMRVVKQ